MQRLPLLFILILSLTKGHPQDLSPQQVERYSEFGKAWGLLKYFHPNLANGNLNWNDSLRNYIPKVKSCTSDGEFNALVQNIYKNCGSFIPGPKSIPTKKYFTKTFNTDWIIASKILDSVNKGNLNNLIVFFQPKKNNLVAKESSPYDINIIHNNPNDNLATLIIAWNIIKYEAPHLKLGEIDWDSALDIYIPIVSKSDSPANFEYILAEMISKINDSHNFMTLPNFEKELGGFSLPFNIAFVENKNIIKLIDTAACRNCEIQIGDIIETINSRTVTSLRDSFRKISRGGHIKVVDNEVNEFYLTKAKSRDPIKITYKKADGNLIEANVEPVSKINQSDPTRRKAKYYQVVDSIAYVNLFNSTAEDVRKALNKFHHSNYIIIDNRGYPSGKTYSALFNRLNADNARIINYYKQNNTMFTGTFPKEYLKSPYYHVRGYANLLKPFYRKYKGKLIVLFDETTLSHAEFRNQGFSFIKNKVITVGRNTAGADGAIFFKYLPGKIRIAFTGDIVSFPDGKSTQGNGMKPDYYVEDSIISVRNGEDDILNKAIQIAKGKE